MIYCLLVEDSETKAKRREKLDEALANQGRPDPATWGRLPSHQRAMRRAAEGGAVQ